MNNDSRDYGRKAIIAGGRDYVVGPKQRRWLDGIHAYENIEEVVSGGASGADAGGEKWARLRGIAVKRFPADWKAHGKSAGPKRNKVMAKYLADSVFVPGFVILFPGGRGTESMRSIALGMGLQVVEYVDLETKDG